MECLQYETVRDACLGVLKKDPGNVDLELPGGSLERVVNESLR
jgi:hypothetical protein